MARPATTHCAFTCVLQIDEILSEPNDPKFFCNATIQMSPDTTIDGIDDDCDAMSVEVHYYNIFNDIFVENAMVFCIGSLCVIEGNSTTSTDPLLTIRSHCLIRFGTVLLYYYHYNTDRFSAPGDPSEPDYADSVPPSINAFLTFVGPVTHHHAISRTHPRIFTVNLSVYNKTDGEQSTVSAYQLICIIPETRRWEKFGNSPYIGGSVQATGEVIGLCDVNNRRSLCVLIAELSFIPRTTSAPPRPRSATTSPKTPRNRLRRRGNQPAPRLQGQTPSKRPRQESDSRPSSPEITNTETTVDEGEGSGGNDPPAMGKGKRKKMPKVIRD